VSSSRDRIEQEALNSFARIGYHATSIRTLAEACGLRPPTLYHWYPNKEALLVSLMRGFLEGLDREVLTAIDELVSPVDRLAAAIRAHVVYHGMHRRAAFVTDTEVRALTGENRASIVAMRDDYEQLLLRLVRDGVEAGRFETRDARVATRAILLACTGVSMWFQPSGELSLSQVAEIHVELMLNSLRADAKPRAGRPHQSTGRSLSR
jgi:AcrR family transcriptional regulator